MVQCSAFYWWRRNCLGSLFLLSISTDSSSREDGISIEKLFLPDGYESICPGEGTSRHWPCFTEPPTDSGWLRLTALYQSHHQRGHALGPCCAIRFSFVLITPLFFTWHFEFIKQYPTWQCKMTYMIAITLQKGPRFLRISGLSSFNFFC